MSQIVVGISDLNIARAPNVLVTYALGSCVGICLYDSVSKIAGLSHIMLPCIKDISSASNQFNKFADTAIIELVRKMERTGEVLPSRLRAKIAGGAQMFTGINESSLANIGLRNVVAVKKELARLKIPIVAEDTGKDYGRTVYFSAEDGIMRVKSVNKGEWIW